MENLSHLTVLRFSLQLLVCEAAFLLPRRRKRGFPFLAALALILHFALSYAWFYLLRLVPGDRMLLNAVFFLGIAGITALGAGLCFDVAPAELTFIVTCGYATEHIAFAVTRVALYLLGIDEAALPGWADYLFTRFLNYALAAVLVYLFLVRPNSYKEAFRERDGRFMGLAVTVVVAAVVLSSWYTAPEEAETARCYTNFVCPLYSSICCLLVITMEYFVFRENRLALERETMEQMMRVTEAQRRTTKEAIDIINLRCHDLKHQMKALITETDSEEKREYIESIRRATDIYDSAFHTGSEALDYVLQEKKLLAGEHGVEFACIADGRCLSFLRNVDLYALLGNAIDNALEHLEQEPEGERRLLLNIRPRAGMAAIRLENTCTTPVLFRDGLPETTKPDREAHGFGVRSIRFIAEKYGGDVFMEVKDGRFLLNVMLPIGETGAAGDVSGGVNGDGSRRQPFHVENSEKRCH